MIYFYREITCFQLEDRLTFGKHRGSTISYVAETDPSYILWMGRELKDKTVSKAAHKKATRFFMEQSTKPCKGEDEEPVDYWYLTEVD